MTAPHPDQEPLIEGSRIKFAGMTAEILEYVPEIDDRMTFTVEAECTARGKQRMADGQIRRVATMTVHQVIPHGPPERPEKPPELPFGEDE